MTEKGLSDDRNKQQIVVVELCKLTSDNSGNNK